MSIRSIPPLRWVALAALSAAAILIAAPASARAQCEPDVPSDNSEVGQYLETIPGACGDDSPAGRGEGDEGSGAGGSGPGGDAVGEETADELESISADGEAAAALAESTAPDGDDNGGGEDSGAGAESQSDNGALDAGADAADGSAAAALGGNISGESSDGVGIVLPLVLSLVLLVGIAYFLRTRDQASDT